MIGFLTGRLWQVGAIGAAASASVLAICLTVATANLHRVEKERDEVRASITTPVTGWAARLTTAQNNVTTLQTAVNEQNAKFEALGKESAARLAEAKQGLSLARRGEAAAEAKVAKIMKPLVGGDLCLRVQEADARLLESLR